MLPAYDPWNISEMMPSIHPQCSWQKNIIIISHFDWHKTVFVTYYAISISIQWLEECIVVIITTLAFTTFIAISNLHNAEIVKLCQRTDKSNDPCNPNSSWHCHSKYPPSLHHHAKRTFNSNPNLLVIKVVIVLTLFLVSTCNIGILHSHILYSSMHCLQRLLAHLPTTLPRVVCASH